MMTLSLGQPRYASTIKELIQATDKEIQEQTKVSSHTEPHSLSFATAQRANTDLKVEASIECVSTRINSIAPAKLSLISNSVGRLSMSLLSSWVLCLFMIIIISIQNTGVGYSHTPTLREGIFDNVST